MMLDSCLDHRRKTTCIHGAKTEISSVSTKLEYYNLKLWFKRTDDKSASPNSGLHFPIRSTCLIQNMVDNEVQYMCHRCWVAAGRYNPVPQLLLLLLLLLSPGCLNLNC